jgi:hypothetical protein
LPFPSVIDWSSSPEPARSILCFCDSRWNRKRSYHYTTGRGTGRRFGHADRPSFPLGVRPLHNVLLERLGVPEYQHLTQDELLHLAEEREQLTDEARGALETELSQRRLCASDINAYRLQREAADTADKLKRAVRSYLPHVGLGKRFFGKANRQRDPGGLFEQYDATLWFAVLWFPVFPIATYTVHRDLERWLGMLVASDPVPIERHSRNWEQILLTWAKAAAVLVALRLAFLLQLRHPEWLRHLP